MTRIAFGLLLGVLMSVAVNHAAAEYLPTKSQREVVGSLLFTSGVRGEWGSYIESRDTIHPWRVAYFLITNDGMPMWMLEERTVIDYAGTVRRVRWEFTPGEAVRIEDTYSMRTKQVLGEPSLHRVLILDPKNVEKGMVEKPEDAWKLLMRVGVPL